MQDENEARAEAAELEVDEPKASLRITSRRWMYSKRARFSITSDISALARAKESFAICFDLTPESAAEWLILSVQKKAGSYGKLLPLEQNERGANRAQPVWSRLTSWCGDQRSLARS